MVQKALAARLLGKLPRTLLLHLKLRQLLKLAFKPASPSLLPHPPSHLLLTLSERLPNPPPHRQLLSEFPCQVALVLLQGRHLTSPVELKLKMRLNLAS